MSSAGPRQIPLSGETRRAIDEEIGRMVDAAYADAVALLADHREELDAFAEALVAREQVDRGEIEELLRSLSGGGRRLPTRADALPTSREPVAVEMPVPVLPAPEPVAAAEPYVPPAPPAPPSGGERRRRIPAVHVPRGRRVRTGIEAAAASVYAVAAPRLGRRRRKRDAGLA